MEITNAFITRITTVDKIGCHGLLLTKQKYVFEIVIEIKIFDSSIILLKQWEYDVSRDKVEIWLFEVRIRGVGLYL